MAHTHHSHLRGSESPFYRRRSWTHAGHTDCLAPCEWGMGAGWNQLWLQSPCDGPARRTPLAGAHSTQCFVCSGRSKLTNSSPPSYLVSCGLCGEQPRLINTHLYIIYEVLHWFPGVGNKSSQTRWLKTAEADSPPVWGPGLPSGVPRGPLTLASPAPRISLRHTAPLPMMRPDVARLGDTRTARLPTPPNRPPLSHNVVWVPPGRPDAPRLRCRNLKRESEE